MFKLDFSISSMKKHLSIFLFIVCYSCGQNPIPEDEKQTNEIKGYASKNTSITILGTIQDAGSPHIACKKECCKNLFDEPDKNRQVISLGLIDGEHGKKYLFEATPDISRQLKTLKNIPPASESEMPDGIFLTHAHIGHYTGLMYLGKEATNASAIPVFAMPKMSKFLTQNGPWSQLVSNQNIALKRIVNEKTITLSPNIQVTPFLVPHRDEYSETVGYKIEGPNKSALFIPDIDKWEKWEKSIVEEIKLVDYAFLDATFYSGKEINNRAISEIPHPFIIESLEKFKGLSDGDKAKVIFIHFNHSNPVIDPASEESKMVLEFGFQLGRINQSFDL